MAGLTVNLEHVATLREATAMDNPDPVAAAILAELAGADCISVYLQEQRRHIQDRDVRVMRQTIRADLMLQMAPTSEMVGMALDVRPDRVMLVAEAREDELQDIALDLVVYGKSIFETVDTLQSHGISVGVVVAPQPEQVKMAHQASARQIRIHAGRLAAAATDQNRQQALGDIIDAVKLAHKLRMTVAVGHGLNYHTVKAFRGLAEIDEFSIGHSIVSRAVMVGMQRAVAEMQAIIRGL